VLGVLVDVAELTDDATVVIVDELTPPTWVIQHGAKQRTG
jgi:phenylpyruvate tautomerase PptA (4-oxalocrotonate tautomerase family)